MRFKKINNRYASIISVLLVGLIIFNFYRSWVFAAVYLFLIALAIVWKSFGALVEKAWMAVAGVIGLVMPKVMLSIVFYVLLTPIALLSRLVKKEDALNKKNDNTSLWKSEVVDYSPESFEKMW